MGATDERPLRFLDPEAEDFTGLVDSLAIEPRLALDTESDPYHRYYEKVCLMQISTPREDFFFDPLAHGMPDPVRRLLSDEQRLLVIHGADYDVRALKKAFGLTLGRIFDTSVAGQILGLESFGLKPLLEQELGVEIDKKEQRSDWAKRPLSPAQLEYARQDTRYLLDLADRLLTRLDEVGRSAWLEEECAILRTKKPIEKTFDPNDWKSVKGAKQLKATGRKVLKAAFIWRERVAMERDVPPFRVMRNDVLLRLAQRIQQDRRRAARLRGLGLLPRHLDLTALEQALSEGLAGPDPDENPPKKPKKTGVRLDKPGRARLTQLREGRGEWAKRLCLDPGFLISGTVLERIAAANPKTPSELANIEGMTAWRVQALQRAILARLQL